MTPDDVIAAVAAAAGVDREVITRHDRRYPPARVPRAACVRILRDQLGWSWPQIADAMRAGSHSSMIATYRWSIHNNDSVLRLIYDATVLLQPVDLTRARRLARIINGVTKR